MTMLVSMLVVLAQDPAAMIVEAKASDTSGMVILRGGQTVVEYEPTKKGHVQSVSKVMLSLAAGCLQTDGKLPNLDVTLGEVLPKLKGDVKEKVTLRQLMSHVSGVAHLKNEKGQNSEEFKRVKDTRAYALGRGLESEPGKKWYYNNTGMILTVMMIEAIAGEPLPKYLERRLFGPMGVKPQGWMKDGAGNVYGYMGLGIGAGDLAKLGQLVLDEGKWQGKQLIAAEYMRLSTRTAAFAEVKGGQGLVWMFQEGRPGEKVPMVIQHSGDGGSWLVVFPELGVVATRVRVSQKEDPLNFPQMVYQQMRKKD
jgi:CubicO group peptidase (beta-lactamase class C family)